MSRMGLSQEAVYTTHQLCLFFYIKSMTMTATMKHYHDQLPTDCRWTLRLTGNHLQMGWGRSSIRGIEVLADDAKRR